MIILSLIVTVLLCSPSCAFGSEPASVDEAVNELSRDFDGTVLKITASMDFSKQKKIDTFLDSGFSVGGGREVERLWRLLPGDLLPLIDGEIYFKADPGLAKHYIFFIENPVSWIESFHALASLDPAWIITESTHFSLGNPLILINPEKLLSLTVTFWKKSPATCQITELGL